MPTFRRILRAAGLVAIVAWMSGSVVGATPPTIRWDRNADSATGYLLSWGTASGQYSRTIDVGNEISHVFTEGDPAVRYYFAVRAYNSNGTSAYSVEVATAAVNSDTTPPVISAVTTGFITASGATVTWTTNEASDSQVDFGLTTAYENTSAWNGTLVTAHTVSLSGLTGGVVYHVRVRSRDAAGNLAVSGDVILRRLPRGDADGDGKADLTVFRPDSGTWFTRQSSTDYESAFAPVQWGLNGDLPVPGDYDCDGRMDLIIYRPANGVWYIRPSSMPSTRPSIAVGWSPAGGKGWCSLNGESGNVMTVGAGEFATDKSAIGSDLC